MLLRASGRTADREEWQGSASMKLASHPSTATGHRGRPGSCLQPGVDRRPRATRGAGLRTHGDSHMASPHPSAPSLGPERAVPAATSELLSQRPTVPKSRGGLRSWPVFHTSTFLLAVKGC